MKLSATQLKKWRMCNRLYAFEYVENFKPLPSPKQAFGSETHSHLEQWLSNRIVPPDTSSGRVAKQGITKPWLPAPNKDLLIEKNFVMDWDEDLQMGGFVDCCIPPNLTPDKVPIVIDHKTTSSLRWVQKKTELENDPQALIYMIWCALYWNVSTVKARWIYYAATNPKQGARAPAGVEPVEIMCDVKHPDFINKVEGLIKDSRNIYEVRKEQTKGLELSPNPRSCQSYSGCPHLDRCNLDPLDKLEGYMS